MDNLTETAHKGPSLYSLSLSEMEDYFVANKLPKFSASQIFNWIYQRGVFDLHKWSNISKKVKAHILEQMETSLPKVVWHGLSKDGTRKFLIGMADGHSVELVAIFSKKRLTFCLSSQVGCAIGCHFCHTGTMGLTRHLRTEEIVGQFMAVTKWLRENSDENVRPTNIVYMGQGEPLHNYKHVKKATQIFMEEKGIGLGQRKITLSTSGLVPQIEKLWDFPPVNIAISLHASQNHLRTELMPINKAFDLERLFEAIKKIPLKANRRITYEYILIKDFNDRQEDLDGLFRLLDKRESKVNLIPFNEYPQSHFKRPSEKRIRWFMEELNRKGLTCTIRTTKGDDILAACGQLKSEKEGKLNLWN